jgi:hypothetical protein
VELPTRPDGGTLRAAVGIPVVALAVTGLPTPASAAPGQR